VVDHRVLGPLKDPEKAAGLEIFGSYDASAKFQIGFLNVTDL
jgi:hypothetical protein